MLYELPFGTGKALLGTSGSVVNSIHVQDGGWERYLLFRTGSRLATCGSAAVQNGGDACLADATGINPNLARGQQSPNRFFDTTAFVNRLGGETFRYGKYRPGHDYRTRDYCLGCIPREEHSLGGTAILRVPRGVFLNMPNHPIFGIPGTSPGTSNYGVISGTSVDSRQLSLG